MTELKIAAVGVKPLPNPEEDRREFMLAALRTARRRVDLIGAELDEIGVTLKRNMISPEYAVSWLVHAGLADFVNAAPWTNKIEAAA